MHLRRTACAMQIALCDGTAYRSLSVRRLCGTRHQSDRHDEELPSHRTGNCGPPWKRGMAASAGLRVSQRSDSPVLYRSRQQRLLDRSRGKRRARWSVLASTLGLSLRANHFPAEWKRNHAAQKSARPGCARSRKPVRLAGRERRPIAAASRHGTRVSRRTVGHRESCYFESAAWHG